MAVRGMLATLWLVVAGLSCSSQKLTFYFLDMVGGASTLIVTPSGESILIDTGSLEPRGRDDGRIIQACHDAGLKKIDHLITTHFHSDHFGALFTVTKKIKVGTFYDKGGPPALEEQEGEWFKTLYPKYQQATAGRTLTLQPGETIPLRDNRIKLLCVAAEKKVLGFSGDVDAAQPGFDPAPADHSDNARSIALLLSYGDFTCFMGGDITLNVEHHLIIPVNHIGQVDLYQVTHHGLDLSNNPELLQAIQPVVAVAMNGPQKGIQPRTFAALQSLPSLQALYQLHENIQSGAAGNTPLAHIANRKGEEHGTYVRVTVDETARQMTVSLGAKATIGKYPYQ